MDVNGKLNAHAAGAVRRVDMAALHPRMLANMNQNRNRRGVHNANGKECSTEGNEEGR
jgi:hypothetical protein